MRYPPVLMVVITLAALVGACDKKAKNEPPPPPLPQMIQDQKQLLDSTKGMGDTLDKQAEEQRKRVEEATK